MRPRCCDDPDNLSEMGDALDGSVTLVCVHCGRVVAHADDRGELFADY